MKCGAHTLQCAVFDSIRQIPEIIQLIDWYRTVAKKFTKPIYWGKLNENGLKKPKISTNTRWHRNFDMIEIVYEFRNFILQFLHSVNGPSNSEDDFYEYKKLKICSNASKL